MKAYYKHIFIILFVVFAASLFLVPLDVAHASGSPSVDIVSYRWINDDGTEATATGDTENTATTSIKANMVLRLRYGLDNIGNNNSNNARYILQWGTNSDCTTGFTSFTAAGTCGTSPFCMYDTQLVDGDVTTDSAAVSNGTGVWTDGEQTDNLAFTTDNLSINDSPDEFSEIEYGFQVTSYAVAGQTYYFRPDEGDLAGTLTVCPRLDMAVAGADPTLEFGTHRWFQNAASTSPGRPAMINQPIIAPPQGTPFRLRFNLHVKDADLTSTTTKLQFASKVGVCGTPGDESYSDVTTSSAIRFYYNAGVDDDAAIGPHKDDPRHASTTGSAKDIINLQNYNDGTANTTFSSGAINQGEDGLWDVSLVDFSAIANTSYCFLVVQSGGGLLDDYGSSTLPEIRTAQEIKVRLRGTVRLRMVRLR